MPFINVQITRGGVTAEQKRQIIKGATDLMVNILNKDPASTFVIIDEVDTDNWGVAGEQWTLVLKRQAAEKDAAHSKQK